MLLARFCILIFGAHASARDHEFSLIALNMLEPRLNLDVSLKD